MFLGLVVGTLVASRKEGTLEGLKFLVLRQIDVDRTETGTYVVAADAVGAGIDNADLGAGQRFADGIGAERIEIIERDDGAGFGEPIAIGDRNAQIEKELGI